MAATLSCHYCPSLSPSSKLINLYNIPRLCPLLKFSEKPLFSPTQTLLFFPNSPSISNPDQEDRVFPFKECAISIAVSDWGRQSRIREQLLRHALPIDNKAIREVQKPLEDITDSLKIAGLKALDSVERNVRQASRALKQGKSLLVSGLAESKKDHGIELLGNLEDGMDDSSLIYSGLMLLFFTLYLFVLHAKCLEFYDIFFVEVLIGNTINFVLDQSLDLYKAQTRLKQGFHSMCLELWPWPEM
ncbi:hypothetical protein HYC85_006069 [Camellia sinensis]|uniref:peptidylprolyl isomerase n=1 Tax=Camellia sinensis TaxID=4442 RepID=A0A7J7I339_CAMSI|nr:hypothetical protein HYC85_006069 [Camellia sinensis]